MIELLVVRHAIAEDREEFAATGQSDDLRPLTKRGRGRMEDAARGLASLTERPDVIATSPYTRAAETATIVAQAFGGADPVPVDLLTPDGSFEALASWLRDKVGGADAKVAIVGHEPHLSGFVSYLLGARGNVVDLKKGAACLLRVDPSVKPGSAVLVWALAPGQLRRLK
jgi:phosphohistidine phosphatase